MLNKAGQSYAMTVDNYRLVVMRVSL